MTDVEELASNVAAVSISWSNTKVTELLGETSVALLVGLAENSFGTGGGGGGGGGGGMYASVLKPPETVARAWPAALDNGGITSRGITVPPGGFSVHEMAV